MKRKLLPGCFPLIALLVGGSWWAARGLRGAPPKAAERYETVGRGDVAVKVTETGTIEPLKKVEVKSKVAGRVARLLVQEGSRVRSGQLLAQISAWAVFSADPQAGHT